MAIEFLDEPTTATESQIEYLELPKPPPAPEPTAEQAGMSGAQVAALGPVQQAQWRAAMLPILGGQRPEQFMVGAGPPKTFEEALTEKVHEAGPEAVAINKESAAFNLREHMALAKERPSDKLQYWAQRLPWSPAGIIQPLEVKSAADRIQAGVGEPKDFERMADFLTSAERQQKAGIISKAVDIATGLPAFALEFASTGGAYSGAKQAAQRAGTTLLEQAVSKAAERNIGSRMLRQYANLAAEAPAFAAGAVAQTIANPKLIAQNLADAQLNNLSFKQGDQGQIETILKDDDSGFMTQLRNAFVKAGFEIGTEYGGELLHPLKAAVISRWLNRVPGRTPGMLSKVFEKVKFHGIIGEMFEERLNEFAAPLYGEQYHAPTPQQLAAEALAFGLPAGANRLLTGRAPVIEKGQNATTTRTEEPRVERGQTDVGIPAVGANRPNAPEGPATGVENFQRDRLPITTPEAGAPEAAAGAVTPKAPLAVRILTARGAAPDVADFVAARAGDKPANETAENYRARVNQLHDEFGFMVAREVNPASSEASLRAAAQAEGFTEEQIQNTLAKARSADAAVHAANTELIGRIQAAKGPAPTAKTAAEPQIEFLDEPKIILPTATRVTEADITKLADAKGIKWDYDPAFMDFTEGLTGKRHLSELNPEERAKVFEAVKARPAVAPAPKPKGATPDRVRRINIQQEAATVTFPDPQHTELFALHSRFSKLVGGNQKPGDAENLQTAINRVKAFFGFKDQAETMRAALAYRQRVIDQAKEAIKTNKTNEETRFDAPAYEPVRAKVAQPEAKPAAQPKIEFIEPPKPATSTVEPAKGATPEWERGGRYRWTALPSATVSAGKTIEGTAYRNPRQDETGRYILPLIADDGSIHYVWADEGKIETINPPSQAGHKLIRERGKQALDIVEGGFHEFNRRWDWHGANPADTYQEYKKRAERESRPLARSTDAAVKQAIADARKNGPTPEFRALFGGIEPSLVGTTAEKVSQYAESLGLNYSEMPAQAAPETPAVSPAVKFVDVSAVEGVPATENGGRIAIILPNGSAAVGGRIHAQTWNLAVAQGIATDEELGNGTAGFVKPDGSAWAVNGKTLARVSRVAILDATTKPTPPALPSQRPPQPTGPPAQPKIEFIEKPKLPPVQPGFVRMFHGGSDPTGNLNGDRDITQNFDYAKGYADRNGYPVWYVDVPENSPFMSLDEGASIGSRKYWNMTKAPADVMRNAKVAAPGRAAETKPAIPALETPAAPAGTQAPTPTAAPAPATEAEAKIAAIRVKRKDIEERIRKKLGATNMGVDPEMVPLAAELAVSWAEEGVVRFSDFARRVKESMPDVWDKLKNYLRGAWSTVADMHDGLDQVTKEEAQKVFAELEQPAGTPSISQEPGAIDKTKTTTEPEIAHEPTPPTRGQRGAEERPVVPEPPNLAPGQPARPAARPGAEPERTGGVSEPGGPVGEPGVRSGGKKGGGPGRGERTGPEQPGPAGEPAGGRAAPERQGVERRPEGGRQRDVAPDQNLRIQPDDRLAPDSRSARITANIRSVQLSKKLEQENRQATPTEKRVIMQFSGWGDTFQVFGMTQVSNSYTAEDVYEREKDGQSLYNILYNPDDQKRYENWKKQYAQAYDNLKTTLAEDEWNSAKESSLNAHYTSRTGVEALWKIADRLGFRGGIAVESSAGIGNIIGLTPEKFAANTHWIGVELDKLTGRMLKQLYPRADIQITGFEKSLRTQNNSADLIISNFPFGNFDVADSDHPDYDGWNIHNYFLARSVDVAKPGQLVVAITSHYTLDSAKGQKMRQWLAQRADLVGAIRLPSTAFKESAGTEVVTDIVVFRKRDGIQNRVGERFTALAKVEVPAERRAKQQKDESDADFKARTARPVMVNEYFVAHPEMVLGEHSMKGTMYAGDTYTVDPRVGELEQQLSAAISHLPENIIDSEKAAEDAAEAAEVQIVTGQKPGRYLMKNGRVMQVDDQGRLVAQPFKAAEQMKAGRLIEMRDKLTSMIGLELSESSTDAEIEHARRRLNEDYDEFARTHGAINSQSNDLIDDDPEFPLLASLEDEQRVPFESTVKGKKVTRYATSYIKGPMLLRRVNFPRTEPTKADNLGDAVSISLNYRGGISPEYVGKLVGIETEEARRRIIEEQLAYDNPATGLLDPPDMYLSGFVKEKLAEARRAVAKDERFQRNVDALEKVQPKALPAEKIYFRLGSNWLKPQQIERFILDVLDSEVSVTFIRAGDETRWTVSEPDRKSTANTSTYAGGGVAGHELVANALNLKLTEVTTQVEDEHGNKKTVKLPEETAAARDMQGQIQEAFRAWALKSSTEAQEIEATYNELFNGLVRREYPVPKFDRFPGASDMVTLRDWQKRGAARAVQEGTLFAHTVGTGKTYTLITTAMEMRRLGVARKPLIVVQNSTLTQFANSFRRLYPTANLLVGNQKQTEGDKRKAFVARVATRDYDAVVIPVSFFERIPNDPAREQAYVQEQLDQLEQMIREAEGRNYDPSKKPKSGLGKQLIMVKRRFENKMAHILDRLAEKSDALITFEQLGVDALLVDEAHHFKRGDFQTKMDRVKGLDTNGSDRSMDFLLKTQWIHMKSPDRNVILATGTPISNTLAEMWTMLRYARPGLLKQFGVETFDDFVGTFATTVATVEENPTGGFSQVLRLARYVNGPEIGQFWRAGADVYVLSRDDFKALGVNVPEVRGGGPKEVVLERPESVGQFVEFLRDWRLWWENLDGKEKALLSYVPILQYGLARKAAIDLRLINPNWPDDPGSKVNRVVDDLIKVWKDTKDIEGTQLVFSNLYRSHDPKQQWLNEEMHMPNPLYGQPVFNLFDDMKRKLVARGVAESEIADFTTFNEAQRFVAAEQVKAGKIRIALGSTETLGTGLNLQDHIVAIHHVDPQFRPMDFEQRNGRGVRQGNQNKEIDLFVYGVKRTLDSTLYQLMLTKQKFIAQMMTADNLSREFEDPADESTMSFQQMSAAFSGNPLYARRFGLENEVRKLEILDEDFVRKRSAARNELGDVQQGRTKFEDNVKVTLAAKEAMDRAFEGRAIRSVTSGDRTAEGEEGKKLLDEIFTQAFHEMEANLNAEFASGDLARAQADNIAKVKRGYYAPHISRTRTRRFTFNGVPFDLLMTLEADIAALANGTLSIGDRSGRWKVTSGLNIAEWSDDKPWYSSLSDLYGHATSGPTFQTSVWNLMDRLNDRAVRVEPARKRFDKVRGDLERELDRKFEGGPRLRQQKEQLAEVLAELQASGAGTGQQSAPAMEDIAARYPRLAYLTRQIAAEGSADALARIARDAAEKAKNTYYALIDGAYKPLKGTKPVRLPGYDWIEAITTEEKNGKWTVIDVATGVRLSGGDSREAAVAAAVEMLGRADEKTIRDKLRDLMIKHGLTPRMQVRDAEDTAAFARFQTGLIAKFEWEGQTYEGPIRSLNPGRAQVGIEVSEGRTLVVPSRLVALTGAREEVEAKPSDAPAQKIDPIEAALNKAIEATDPLKGGKMLEGVTGAPVWLTKSAAHGALLALRAAYRAGKSIAQAVTEAVEWLKAQKLGGFNDQEAKKWLSDQTPEAQAKPVEEAQAEPVATRVLGLDVETQRRVLTAADNAAGDRDAEKLFDEAGIPWRREAGLVVPSDLTTPQEAAGQKLLEILRREIDPVHQAQLARNDAPPNDRRANFINSVVELARRQGDLWITGDPTIFSRTLAEELGGTAQEPRSEAGKKLFLFKEPQIGEIERIALAPLGALRDIWREEYDPKGMAGRSLQTIKLYFQNFFDSEQVDRVLAGNPEARAFLDEMLGESTISPKPSVADMVRLIFDSPRYKKLGRDEKLAVMLGRQLGVDPAKMHEALGIFDEVFAESIKEAETKALAQAQNALAPAERRLAGPGTKLWKKIQNFVNAGGLEEYELLKSWAASKGIAVPTTDDAAELRTLSERSQRLLELTPRQRADVGNDADKVQEARDARARAMEDERKALQKKMMSLWKRWSRPLSWRHWLAGADVAYNNAQAINEMAAGNILARLTFATKQTIDVGTANLFYTPQRALAHAFKRYSDQVAAGADDDGARADLWKDIGESIAEAYRIRNKTFGARVNAFMQGLAGRGLPQNVEGIKGGTHVFDRLEVRINELLKKGTPEARVQAFLLTILGLQKLGFRVAGALDVFQGVPAEFQEIQQQVVTELRRQGKPRGVAMAQADEVIGDIQAERATALDEARALLEESGLETTDQRVSKAAWEIVRGRMYARIRTLGLAADEFEKRNDELRQLIGWNLPIGGGPGKIVAGMTKGLQYWFARGGIPTLGLGAFGNAIGTMLNRKLTWMGFGFTPKRFQGDPWFQGEMNQMQRKIEAGTGVLLGAAVFAMAATGALVFRGGWPKDPKERERWLREGTRPNTVEFPLGDGRKAQVSTTTGPLWPLAAHLAAGGAYHDLMVERARKQEALNAEAAAKGIAAGKIAPINTLDVVAVMAAGAKTALFGGRTVSGAWATYSDLGALSIKKAGAATLGAAIPFQPAYTEMTRLAGVSLDPARASFWDLMVPLPPFTSRLNMLGDDVGNPDAVQRVLGMLTGGTTIRTQGAAESGGQAYANLFATGYRPPALNPAQGHEIGGEFRPLTPKEFTQYSRRRGEQFKQELEALGPLDNLDPKEAHKAVQEAFQRANTAALRDVGVTVAEPGTGRAGGRAASGAAPSGAVVGTGRTGGIRSGLTGGTQRGRLRLSRARGVRFGRRGLSRASRIRLQPSLGRRGRRLRGLSRVRRAA